MKKCKKCLELKGETDFNKLSISKDGLANHCKRCRSLARNRKNKLRTIPVNDSITLISICGLYKDYIGYGADLEGNIWSCRTNKVGYFQEWHKIKQLKSHNGYVRVGLYATPCNVKHFFIHRIIADIFLVKACNDLQVNHIDGNKLNNNIKNLEWVTPKENTLHAISMGKRPDNSGQKHGLAKLKDSDIFHIFDAKRSGILQRDIAIKFSVSQSTISEVLNRKKFRHVQV